MKLIDYTKKKKLKYQFMYIGENGGIVRSGSLCASWFWHFPRQRERLCRGKMFRLEKVLQDINIVVSAGSVVNEISCIIFSRLTLVYNKI